MNECNHELVPRTEKVLADLAFEEALMSLSRIRSGTNALRNGFGS